MHDLIAKHGLTEMAQQIVDVSRPCIVGATHDGPVALGASKAGGQPHTPDSFQWPFFRDTPLEFVAQVNCSEANAPELPDHGLLLFFYDNRHGGYSLKEEGFIRVFYSETLKGLRETPPPQIRKPRLWGLLGTAVLPVTYRETALTFQPAASLPDPERNLVPLADDGIFEAYCEIKAELQDDRFIQIGGFPNPVQSDDMQPAIAGMTGRGAPEDWVMILEVYNDARTDMMWGDDGRIHYFCHQADLDRRDFSRCWMQMQCG